MGVFDNIVAKVSEEDRAVLDKYPELKTSVEELESRLTQASEFTSKWEDWAKDNYDFDARATKSEIFLKNSLAEANAQLAELAAKGDTEMTFEDILKRGVLTEESLASKVQPIVKDFAKAPEVDQKLDQLSRGFQYFYETTQPLAFKHFKEFDEPLDIRGLVKHMNESGMTDPNAAYDAMVRERREERQKSQREQEQKEYEAKIEAARKEGEEQGRRTAAMSENGQMPVDTAGPSMGHLQAKKMAAAKSANPDSPVPEAELGAGVLAQAGWEELKQKQAVQ